MTDLQKYLELYNHFATLDQDTLFAKAAVIRDALAEGANKDALLTELGKESGDSKAMMRKLYSVARVFPEGHTAKDFDFWVYAVCATSDGVNPDNKLTYYIAHEWLNTAIKGYDSKQGRKAIRRKHTARTLKAAIRAASAPKAATTKPVVETVYSGICIIGDVMSYQATEGVYTTVEFSVDGVTNIIEGQAYTVTITRSQPLPESASESGVAA